MNEIVNKAIHDLRIGDLRLGSEATMTEEKTDIQGQLLQETRQKLFGPSAFGCSPWKKMHNQTMSKRILQQLKKTTRRAAQGNDVP
jgi:hypothetical protein